MNPLARIALALALVLVATATSAPTALDARTPGVPSRIARQSGPFDAIDVCVQQEMQNKGTPGASLAVAVAGRQVYTQTYGVKRAGLGEAIGPDSYFRINSSTKMMTAAAVMKAVERGQLALHAPVTDYLPELALRAPWHAGDVTLHHLLSSSSGLPGIYVDPESVPTGQRPPSSMSLQAWAGNLRHMHLFAPPASFFNYSSAGFSLAGAALERATGRVYPQIVEQDLWRPAGMLRTTMDPDVVIADGDYATGHYGGRNWDPREYQEPFAEPAGGAYGTPSELLTWAGMLAEDGRGVLAPESVAAMTSPHAVVSNVPITSYAAYGYGVFVEDFRRRGDPNDRVRVLYHPGNGRGYSTELFWVPETGFAIAILANTVSGLNQSALCALREVEGLTRLPVDRTPPDEATLERYTGTWAMVDAWGKTWTARVWKGLDGLRIRYTDWSTLPSIAAVVPEATMSHRYGAAFNYGGYGSNDALFVDDGSRAHAQWMEQANSVGQRAGDLPEEIEVNDGACTALRFTPDLDLPGSALRAFGPNPVHVLRDVAVSQDDPDRPDLASFKLDLPAEGEVAFLMAYHWAEEDDDLDLYLLRDADGDGEHRWPDELVDQATGSGAQGVLAHTPLPAGRYQLWVHGKQVGGVASAFDLDVVMVAGAGLRLNAVPEQLVAGAEQVVEVCADSLGGDEPHLAMVTLDLGDGLRVARVSVLVAPRPAGPQGAAYLPALWTGERR